MFLLKFHWRCPSAVTIRGCFHTEQCREQLWQCHVSYFSMINKAALTPHEFLCNSNCSWEACVWLLCSPSNHLLFYQVHFVTTFLSDPPHLYRRLCARLPLCVLHWLLATLNHRSIRLYHKQLAITEHFHHPLYSIAQQANWVQAVLSRSHKHPSCSTRSHDCLTLVLIGNMCRTVPQSACECVRVRYSLASQTGAKCDHVSGRVLCYVARVILSHPELKYTLNERHNTDTWCK